MNLLITIALFITTSIFGVTSDQNLGYDNSGQFLGFDNSGQFLGYDNSQQGFTSFSLPHSTNSQVEEDDGDSAQTNMMWMMIPMMMMRSKSNKKKTSNNEGSDGDGLAFPGSYENYKALEEKIIEEMRMEEEEGRDQVLEMVQNIRAGFVVEVVNTLSPLIQESQNLGENLVAEIVGALSPLIQESCSCQGGGSAERVGLDIRVRNGLYNSVINSATVSVSEIVSEDGSPDVPIESLQDVTVDSNGNVFLEISNENGEWDNGKYAVSVQASGFITANFIMEVNCESAADCPNVRLVALSPELEAGQTRLMMTWIDKPEELDFHVMSVKISDNSYSLCRTSYENQDGCEAITLHQDNNLGDHNGGNGAETMTLWDSSINQEFVYLIGVHDYYFEEAGSHFLESRSAVTITNGIKSVVTEEIFAESITEGEQFHLFGCIRISADGDFTFKPTPEAELFDGSGDDSWFEMYQSHCSQEEADEEAAAAAEEDTFVGLDLTLRNSQDNSIITPATVSVSRLVEDGSMPVAEGVPVDNGHVFIKISDENGVWENGRYAVSVQATGFITADFIMEVNCESAADCQNVRLVAMSPELEAGQIRIMMTWIDHPNDLDFYVMAVRKSDKSMCKTYYANNCEEITLDMDTTSLNNGNGAETMTLWDSSFNQDFVYLIGTHDYSFEQDGSLFLDSSAAITITNGVKSVVSEEIFHESITEDEQFHLFGCIRISAVGDFTFKPAPEGALFDGHDDDSWLSMYESHCMSEF